MMNINAGTLPKTVLVLTASAVLTGCYTMPEGAYPDARQGSYGRQSGYEKPAEQQGTPTVYAEGCWAFSDSKGRRQVNVFERLDDYTILVTRVGTNKPHQYERIEYGLYQATGGAATYKITNSLAVWSSNDNRRITIRLSYVGNNC